MTHPRLIVRRLRTRAVRVPMRRPLGTSAARMQQAPFVLVDLETEEGVTGRAHAFCYLEDAAPMIRRCVELAGDALVGRTVDPEAFGRACNERFRLLGVQGIVAMAVSALDVACWDALSSAAGVPLAKYLGGSAERVPAYNSNGLSLGEPTRLGEEAAALLDEGFEALKLRLGRRKAAEDLQAIRTVRGAVPDETPVMTDFNQALTVAEALERAPALDAAGLYWIEEPVTADDWPGCARVAAARRTPVQLGENLAGPAAAAGAAALKASDFLMPDLMRIGGVSGWLEMAALAQDAGLPLSSHLYPEVSVHLLAASPTAHWLEYVDWAEPFLAERLRVAGGTGRVPARPGTGIAWDEGAVAHYAIG
jgi:mandelate racemase